MKKLNFPPLGMRTIKTALVVFTALVFSLCRKGNSQPFDIAFAAVLCIQPTMDSLKNAGKNRMIGTAIGGAWGSLVMLTNVYLLHDINIILRYAVISVGIIPVIYSVLLSKKTNSVPISCATYLLVTVRISQDTTPFSFLFNRLLDTFTGIIIASFINRIYLPKEQEKNNVSANTQNTSVEKSSEKVIDDVKNIQQETSAENVPQENNTENVQQENNTGNIQQENNK